jgi:hypothetical protein
VLISDLKNQFATNIDGMNDFKRNSALYSLLALRYKDDELLEMTCQALIKGKGSNSQTLTNTLYLLAKFKYQPD